MQMWTEKEEEEEEEEVHHFDVEPCGQKQWILSKELLLAHILKI